MTDTSWSWIASYVRDKLNHSLKNIVFHPVSSDYWHAPGNISIYGPATKYTKKDTDFLPGLLIGDQYVNYSQNIPVNDINRGAPSSIPITENDFNFFVKKMQKYL